MAWEAKSFNYITDNIASNNDKLKDVLEAIEVYTKIINREPLNKLIEKAFEYIGEQNKEIKTLKGSIEATKNTANDYVYEIKRMLGD